MMGWLLAGLHLVALGVGLGAVWMRARAFRSGTDPAGIRRALAADNAWGLAAVLWLVTGGLRAFGGFEKGTSYYLQSDAFLAKMALFGLVLVLELWPMVTLIRVRLGRASGMGSDQALAFARISEVQALLLVAMVFLASAMARGLWH
jgi:putative membrane protein